MIYTASVIDKRTGLECHVDGDFRTRREFEFELYRLGYMIYQIEPKEVFDFMLRGEVDWSPESWRKARLLYKKGVPITRKAMEEIE